jgi:hypothetical protein
MSVIARLIVRFRRRATDLICPDTGTTAIPGEHCAHTTAAATELTVRRLLVAAVTDTQKFAVALANLGGCPACSLSVLAQMTYSLCGFVFDQEQHTHEDKPAACSCEDPIAAEVLALRLVLCASGDDDHFAVANALENVIDCQSCLLAVLFALVSAQVTILGGTNVAWRPLLERQLMALLDQAAAQ